MTGEWLPLSVRCLLCYQAGALLQDKLDWSEALKRHKQNEPVFLDGRCRFLLR